MTLTTPIDAVKKTIQKVKKGEVALWGRDYNCKSEGDFDTKLRQYSLISNDVKMLDQEIQQSIERAVEGASPELLIELDDTKLNLDVYQQIMSKVYAAIRYQVYQRLKSKEEENDRHLLDGSKELTRSQSEYLPARPTTLDNANSPLLVSQDEIQDLINQLDITAIRVEVFNLYGIKYGLDPQLSLRKL